MELAANLVYVFYFFWFSSVISSFDRTWEAFVFFLLPYKVAHANQQHIQMCMSVFTMDLCGLYFLINRYVPQIHRIFWNSFIHPLTLPSH